MGGDGFAAANGVDAFVGFGFEVNSFRGKAQRFGEHFAHLGEMRAKLRALKDHNGVDVLDGKVPFVKKLANVFEKVKAVRAFPLGIAIWEMRANVAEAGGAEERIANGVREDVAVGMPDRPFAEGNYDAADDEIAASGEAMQVVANSAAKAHDLLGSDWR
jgi:hypothetical protein